MKGTVQARLDPETQQTLQRLTRQLGWSESEVVRAGLRLLDTTHPSPGRPKIIGLGQFDSGITDLASNKEHLKGFGRTRNRL